MLPIIPAWKDGSMVNLIETVPQMHLSIQDIALLVEELRVLSQIFIWGGFAAGSPSMTNQTS